LVANTLLLCLSSETVVQNGDNVIGVVKTYPVDNLLGFVKTTLPGDSNNLVHSLIVP